MKTRLKLIRTLALLLACLFVEQAAAATNDVAISLYNRWEHLDGTDWCVAGLEPEVEVLKGDAGAGDEDVVSASLLLSVN